MRAAVDSKVRLGLGVVVLTTIICFAAESLEFAFIGAKPEVLAALRPLALLAVLSYTVGWWLFASPDAAMPGSASVRGWLRVSACTLLLIEAFATFAPRSVWIGVLAWPAAGGTFYLSLVLLGRIALGIGEKRLAAKSFWCMMFAPVLVLFGVAATIFMVMIVGLRAAQEVAALHGGPDGAASSPGTSSVPPLPDIPSWLLFAPLFPMFGGTLWYFGTLALAWWRFGGKDEPSQVVPYGAV